MLINIMANILGWSDDDIKELNKSVLWANHWDIPFDIIKDDVFDFAEDPALVQEWIYSIQCMVFSKITSCLLDKADCIFESSHKLDNDEALLHTLYIGTDSLTLADVFKFDVTNKNIINNLIENISQRGLPYEIHGE